MITSSDFIYLPYTRDLTEGGIAYAIRSLPYTYNRMGGSAYDRLRRIAAGVAVELAFRRYLSEQNIPFDVNGATPFTDPDHYDVSLGGRRCDIKSFLITYRKQIEDLKQNPALVLNAPALVPSDQHAAEGCSDNDLYLFAFLSGLVAASQENMQKARLAGQPEYLIHAMPDAWTRPSQWNPLGRLVMKSESAEDQIVEIGGLAADREMRSVTVKLPSRTRIELDEKFYSVAYIHIQAQSEARIGIHSTVLQDIHIIDPSEWGNIWIQGIGILLAGFITRQGFTRKASLIQPGTRVFQYDRIRTKNLAVPVSELRPLSELFERVKDWAGS